jgi:hypothetical protein
MAKEFRTIRTAIYDKKAGRRKVVDFLVSADLDAVAIELAQKAFNNKSKVARECAGAVECKMLQEVEG